MYLMVRAPPRYTRTYTLSPFSTLFRSLTRRVLSLAGGQRLTHDHLAHLGRVDLCAANRRSEEHTSEQQSLMRISYAVCCLKKNVLETVSIAPKHKSCLRESLDSECRVEESNIALVSKGRGTVLAH